MKKPTGLLLLLFFVCDVACSAEAILNVKLVWSNDVAVPVAELPQFIIWVRRNVDRIAIPPATGDTEKCQATFTFGPDIPPSRSAVVVVPALVRVDSDFDDDRSVELWGTLKNRSRSELLRPHKSFEFIIPLAEDYPIRIGLSRTNKDLYSYVLPLRHRLYTDTNLNGEGRIELPRPGVWTIGLFTREQRVFDELTITLNGEPQTRTGYTTTFHVNEDDNQLRIEVGDAFLKRHSANVKAGQVDSKDPSVQVD